MYISNLQTNNMPSTQTKQQRWIQLHTKLISLCEEAGQHDLIEYISDAEDMKEVFLLTVMPVIEETGVDEAVAYFLETYMNDVKDHLETIDSFKSDIDHFMTSAYNIYK